MENFHLKQIASDIEHGKKEVLYRIDGSYFGTQQKFLEHTIKNQLSSSVLVQSFSPAIPENIKTLIKKYEIEENTFIFEIQSKEEKENAIKILKKFLSFDSFFIFTQDQECLVHAHDNLEDVTFSILLV